MKPYTTGSLFCSWCNPRLPIRAAGGDVVMFGLGAVRCDGCGAAAGLVHAWWDCKALESDGGLCCD